MGKLVDQFVHYAVLSNRASDRYGLGVRWVTWDEISAVKVADFTSADATRHDRDMIDEGVRRHCDHCRIDALLLELGGHVLLPHLDHCLQLRSKVTTTHGFSTLLLWKNGQSAFSRFASRILSEKIA